VARFRFATHFNQQLKASQWGINDHFTAIENSKIAFHDRLQSWAKKPVSYGRFN
jgi:hypothetical protein